VVDYVYRRTAGTVWGDTIVSVCVGGGGTEASVAGGEGWRH
jgi:hypothetical protein